MSHEALHALVPAYAAGKLDAARTEALRAHLATGCPACLRALFVRPADVAPVTASRPWRPAIGLRDLALPLALLAVAVTVGLAWSVWELGRRQHGYRSVLAAIESDRAEQTRRLEKLSRKLSAARAAARRLARARPPLAPDEPLVQTGGDGEPPEAGAPEPGACTPVLHPNGLGQTYADCQPPGTPEEEETYTFAMAAKAADAWPYPGQTGRSLCSTEYGIAHCIFKSPPGRCAVWCYTDIMAGRVRVNPTPACDCPTRDDGEWE